ncbi:MAG TPA: MFS transporter [Planctomycetales bacterium]|jgi:MFS family permease|nr:MFS transporter [Planctomycetales bacterium]
MSSATPFHAPDVRLLFVTRAVRLFAYGFLALILWLYLAALGLTVERIGLLTSMTLLGDVAVSLWITTTADRVGRKRMLIVGAVLMALAGAVFLSTDDFYLLLAAATIGVISPSGNEVGPFLAIEQAALAQVVTTEQRTRVFAWYNLTGSLATAFGALLCGLLVQFLQTDGFTALQSYHIVLWYYAGTGVLLALLFTRLSPTSEVLAVSQSEAEQPRPAAFLGLHHSRGVVLRLSALFALDAFAGGFVLQTIMAYWFQERFHADPATLGGIFWGANFLAGFSALAAASIAKRVGLLNTMIFTHAPSNLLLILVPFMPTLPLAVGVLLLRFAISQMDVPARQSYTAAVVRPDERSAAAGVTGVARTAGAALSPFLVGLLFTNPMLAGAPFVVSGALKLVYDGLLYWRFRASAPSENQTP